MNELLRDKRSRGKLAILASERAYRQEYVDLILSDLSRITRRLQPLTLTERRQLIELFRQFGLIGSREALRDPIRFARRLDDDPIAVSVCRILNDFRPLQQIIDSLWTDSEIWTRLPYTCVALSRHCHVAGIRYSILQAIAGLHAQLGTLFTTDAPLGIVVNRDDDEYVLPLNAIVGERLLLHVAEKDTDTLFEAFVKIAAGLAPHVNRRAIILRTPEARLAGRLFDADKIVRPLLKARSEEFYVASQKGWEWNSRYWEQRALLIADSDFGRGLSYARHAVAIEEHSFPLTTLGKLLLKKMEQDTSERSAVFGEAFEQLSAAIRSEASRSRISVHPYSTLLDGAARFIELGGTLSTQQRSSIAEVLISASQAFPSDKQLETVRKRLNALLRQS